jgi:hypothetical protein
MTTQAPDRIWSGIDIPKTLAAALAAVCAAVAGSFLGVAGTLAGAAIASIIGTVGTEIYARSLKRGAEKLQTYAPTFVKAPAAVGTPPVEAATEEEAPSQTVPAGTGGALRWKRIALIAGAVFVLAISALSMVELFAQRSVASMVGHNSSGTTTVSSVLDGGGSQQSDDPAPAPSATPTETETTEPGLAPEQRGADAPTTDPTATTGPTTAPSTGAPTTGAPEQTPPTGTDPGQGGQGGQENRQQQVPDQGNE